MLQSEPAQVRSWQAWGTYVRLATIPESDLAAAERLTKAAMAEIEFAISRFRPDSELMKANQKSGTPTEISALFRAALAVALEAARVTDGLVNPTLGRALTAAGYDRDFALISGGQSDPASLAPIQPQAWRQIELKSSLLLPPGCTLDLGATGKAWAADLITLAIKRQIGADACLSLGGDVAVSGQTEWPIVVSELLEDLTVSSNVLLSFGGMATSTTRGRRWLRVGREQHHILDPRTNQPSSGPWRTATTIAHTCAAANTAATAAIILGDQAWDWLLERQIPARLVDQHGKIRFTPQWPLELSLPEQEPNE